MSANLPRRPKARTIDVPHPNYPGINVKARIPTGAEAITEGAKLRPFRRVVAVETSRGDVVRHPITTEPHTRVLQDLPPNFEQESLLASIDSWKGILDSDGAEMQLSIDTVMVLYEDWLDVRTSRVTTEAERKAGSPEQIETTISYAMHISNEIARERNKGPFVASSSASPSTGSAETQQPNATSAE